MSQEVEDTTNLDVEGHRGHLSKCLQLFLKTFFTEKVLKMPKKGVSSTIERKVLKNLKTLRHLLPPLKIVD